MNTQAQLLTIEDDQAHIAKLEHQIAELSAKLKWYEEQFRLAQQKRFGASSEKTPPDQLAFDLFNEASSACHPPRRRAADGEHHVRAPQTLRQART